MKILLTRDSRRFNYEQTFGGVSFFSPTLLADSGLLEVQPIGDVTCTTFDVTNLASPISGKVYDHVWLWSQMAMLGKISANGASLQDAFGTGLKGLKVVLTGEIEKPATAYFQVDEGTGTYYENIRSAMQSEFDKGFKRPVGVATRFYAEWLGIDGNGVLPMGKTVVSNHAWMICGWDDEHPGMVKVDFWLGRYFYMPEEVLNAAIDDTYGTVALMLAQTEQEVIDQLKAVKVSLTKKALDLAYNIYILLATKLRGKS